ncbi:hypothetical protein F5B20DRAFT_557574 [Whalleya microplaca]|nr:hypothetical protein F5B20DRAFT_557574 [Whalleya microplaca]
MDKSQHCPRRDGRPKFQRRIDNKLYSFMPLETIVDHIAILLTILPKLEEIHPKDKHASVHFEEKNIAETKGTKPDATADTLHNRKEKGLISVYDIMNGIPLKWKPGEAPVIPEEIRVTLEKHEPSKFSELPETSEYPELNRVYKSLRREVEDAVCTDEITQDFRIEILEKDKLEVFRRERGPGIRSLVDELRQRLLDRSQAEKEEGELKEETGSAEVESEEEIKEKVEKDAKEEEKEEKEREQKMEEETKDKMEEKEGETRNRAKDETMEEAGLPTIT